MHIEGFSELIDFPKPLRGIVYVLFWVSQTGVRTPLYVGQTGRFLYSRMAEYLFADFQASTDFKVGEAIRYLEDVKGCRILVGQQQSQDLIGDETKLKNELLSKGVRLLNGILCYDYRTANKDEVLAKVHAFCDELWQLQPVNL